MKRIVTVLIPAIALFILSASISFGQATRTWVSGVGDDVNPCSRTAPCKTFAGAISKTAAGGEINVLDAGGYGAVTITKSITIDGGGAFASILSSATNGIIINAPNATVTIRNLNINGAGTTLGVNGIRIIDVKEIHIENTNLQNFAEKGIEAYPNNPATIVLNNVTVHNASEGIAIANGASSVTIDNCRFQTIVGAGISVKAGQATVSNSVISGCNTGVATLKDGSIHLSGNVITQNKIALDGPGKFSSSANNTITGNKTPGITPVIVKMQ